MDTTMAKGFDAADWRQIDAVLRQLLPLPASERQAGLAALSLEARIRSRVDSLLATLDNPGPLDGDVLALLPADSNLDPTTVSLEGRCIGHYRLQALLGHGGMSSVYRAVREDGAYDAPVAFKLLSPALLGGDWVQRFQRETALLARLRHPGIASLLDAGIADDGSPWLVTELVEGSSIDRHCQHHHLDLRKRIELVLQLCRAVAYVQRNLIVHRDIKCQNVLVTDGGQIKLLDFGIARVLGEHSETTAVTRVFTPDYAAPEQVRGDPVTTATDVFGIGVVLYRLLTGVLPFPRSDSARTTGRPTPPSRQVTSRTELTVAGRRQQSQQLRGNLDNLVGKALAEHAEDRYPSAQALADDLQAWLEHRPLQARRPSWPYRLRLFVRRRTELAVAITLAVLAATSGLTVALWQAAEAQQQALQAMQAQARAGAVTTFLTELFEASDPDVSGGRIPDARELLATGTLRLQSSFGESPELRAELLYTLAHIHRKIGDHPAATKLRDEARALAANDFDLRLRLDIEAATALTYTQEDEQALLAIDRIEADYAKQLDESLRIRLGILRALALARVDGGLEPALTLSRKMVQRVGESDVDPAVALFAHGTLLGQLVVAGHWAEGQQVGAAALALLDSGHASPTNLIEIHNNLASIEQRLGNLEAAIERRRHALAMARQVYPGPHWRHANLTVNLAGDLALAGRLAEATELLLEAEATFSQIFEQPNRRTASLDNSLGSVLVVQEQHAQALPYFDRAIDVLGAAMGHDHATVLIIRSNRANALSVLGRNAEAEAELLAILDARQEQFTKNHPFVWATWAALASHELRNERPQRAIEWIEPAIEGWQGQYPDGHPRLLISLGQRAQALALLGHHDEALAAYKAVIELANQPGAEVDYGYLNVLDQYSQFLAEQWPERLPETLPALLDDPRLQHARERPQWQRIQLRLDADTRQALQADADL